MNESQLLDRAASSIDNAQIALDELEANCCVPGRSPRMASLSDSLIAARAGIERLHVEPEGANAVIAGLEDAGAQIGSLQVGCCAPARLPLYAEMLRELTGAQRSIKRSFDLAH